MVPKPDNECIRPEHLTLVDGGEIQGQVTHVEMLGADTNMLVQLDNNEIITMRLFGQHTIKVGAIVGMGYSADKAMFFDNNGIRIRD